MVGTRADPCRTRSHLDPGESAATRRACSAASAGIEYGLQAAALHGALRAGAYTADRLSRLSCDDVEIATLGWTTRPWRAGRDGGAGAAAT